MINDFRSASSAPVLSIVVPCFNEEAVLVETANRLARLLDDLMGDGVIALGSRIVFIDDGSGDGTWEHIEHLSRAMPCCGGIKLSGNRGHQHALLAGLLSVGGDVIVSMDADLQDDLSAIRSMLMANADGADIVYGVRTRRDVDTSFKKMSAEFYYRLLSWLGVTVVFNHADYRLMSRPAIEALREYKEVNLFLRGIIPQLGFRTAIVGYRRQVRFAGETKYSLRRMLALALDGITSFSVRPLRLITLTGFATSLLSFLVSIWAVAASLVSTMTVPGWASTVIPMYFLGGIQLLSLGIVGEYLGKVYLETKKRPRFIVEKTVGPIV